MVKRMRRSVDEQIQAVCGNGPFSPEDVAGVRSRGRDGELPNREKIDGFGFIEHAARSFGLLPEGGGK